MMNYSAFPQFMVIEEPQMNAQMKPKQGRKIYHDFFKTKLCPLNLLSICIKGPACTFAHAEEELRESPNLIKTKLCGPFMKGYCKFGDRCCFAHGEKELRSTPDLYKTAVCNLWKQGKCQAGSSCRFAHGIDDLRPAPAFPNFKSSSLKSTELMEPAKYYLESSGESLSKVSTSSGSMSHMDSLNERQLASSVVAMARSITIIDQKPSNLVALNNLQRWQSIDA